MRKSNSDHSSSTLFWMGVPDKMSLQKRGDRRWGVGWGGQRDEVGESGGGLQHAQIRHAESSLLANRVVNFAWRVTVGKLRKAGRGRACSCSRTCCSLHIFTNILPV